MNLGRVCEHARRATGRSFATRDLEASERDGFWVVRIAGDLMAYVAKDAATQRSLARERRVLARLTTRVPFRLPRPVGPIVLEGDIDLREPVPGVTGPAHHARAMADPTLRRALAEWMGTTLRELHDALADAELTSFAIGGPRCPASVARQRHAICAELEGEAATQGLEISARWEARLAELDPRRDTLVHGDFGSHNFAWDEKATVPLGIFDFHDLARGPAWLDLKHLPSYGEAVFALALDRYGRDRVDERDVRLAHAVTALDDLVWHHEDAVTHAARTGRTREQMLAWVREATDAALR